MSHSARLQPSELLRLGPPILVLVGAMLLLPIPDVRAFGAQVALGFGANGPIVAVADLAAGESLLIAGVLARLLGLRIGVGVLAVLAGVAWFGPHLFALEDADPIVRAVGRFLLLPFLGVLLLHLGAAGLGLDIRGRTRWVLFAAYAAAAVVSIASAATYDAFFDAPCIDCAWHNPLLIGSGRGLVRTWQLATAALDTVLAAGCLAAGIGWILRGRPRTRARALVAAGTLAVGAALGLRGLLLVRIPREDPTDERWMAAWVVLIVATLTLSGGVMALAVETWRRVTRMRRIVDSLAAAPMPGALEGQLARALGDPTLRIAYALDEGGTVDTGGAPAAQDTAPGVVVTPIERDGQRLALVSHAAGSEPGALAEAFGPALLLALDNERLRAVRLARLAELRASRARIVAEGDAERQRMERDLHDGVQQQLLSILFDLRLARLDADRAEDNVRAARLGEAETVTRGAVDALRRVAHGIHPAVLTRSGLVPALASLAEESPLPLEVTADGIGRLPEVVEAAAYRVVAEGLAAAVGRGASGMEVSARVSIGRLMLRLRDIGGTGAAPLPIGSPIPVRIADRVSAAGGEATWESTSSDGTWLRVELPCG